MAVSSFFFTDDRSQILEHGRDVYAQDYVKEHDAIVHGRHVFL